MAGIVQLKRSSVLGKVPDAANVEVGEIVVNLSDRILYTKNSTGTVIVVGSGTTSNVNEGANLYYTNARVYANVVAAGFYDTVSNTAPIGASESGTTLTVSHLNSGVTAATYGNATFIPVITVNATGHLSSASNVSISIPSSALNTDVALGTQTSGNYVQNVIPGSGIVITGAPGESRDATIALGTSGVSASTYGGAAVKPVITIDTFGRITSASNVTSTVANSNITGNIMGNQIHPSGVTAATYGNATIIPVFTVDTTGRLTSASNVIIGVSSGVGYPNSSTTTFPTGDYGDFSSIVDAFGVLTSPVYDCKDPLGSSSTVDLNA